MTGRSPFSSLREPIRDDPVREQRVEDHRDALVRGLNLADVRRRAGKTQVQVAEAMGVSQANISRIEHGEDTQISTLRRYVRALGGELEVRVIFPKTST